MSVISAYFIDFHVFPGYGRTCSREAERSVAVGEGAPVAPPRGSRQKSPLE